MVKKYELETEIDRLVESARTRELPCAELDIGDDGDTRAWGVDPDSSAFLGDFIGEARELGRSVYEVEDPKIALMINHIKAGHSPGGSGGGWHVDSVRKQVKLFCYLTDCPSRAFGPLCLFRHPVSIIETISIVINRLIGGGLRFSDRTIGVLRRLGFREEVQIVPKGETFAVMTNFVHRGLPISEGDRVMLTAYIYAETIPRSVAMHLTA